MDSYTAFLLVSLIIISHFVIIEMMARYRYFAFVISVFALLTFSLWLEKFVDWFYFVKILSVWLPLLAYGIIKALYPISQKANSWATQFARLGFFLLVLNILEASFKDLQIGNYLNSATGILLILILPLLSSTNWTADDYKGSPFLIYADTPYFYIFLYSSWNICFVYSVFPQYFLIVALSLAYCLCHVYIIKVPRLWFSFRTFTLGLILMIRANTDLVETHLDLSHLYHPDATTIWGGINLILIFGYLVRERKGEIAHSLIGKLLARTL